MTTASTTGHLVSEEKAHYQATPFLKQIPKLAKAQFREYLRSRRFFILLGLMAAIGVIFTAVVAHYRGSLISSSLGFYGGAWGGAANFLTILVAVFFGGDAIAGEFQNKTGYFLMGLPVRRGAIYLGKFLAAYLASAAVLLSFLFVLLLNGAYYFGVSGFPWQLGVSVLLTLIYLSAVLATTFVFSSLFKTSAYGFVLTALLFLIGFTILQDWVSALAHIEPWMVISYASGTIGAVFSSNPNWGFTGTSTLVHGTINPNVVARIYTVAGVGEGVLIMIGYLMVLMLLGFFLFEREEFT